MTFCIGRRELITLIGGAAAWPLAARAQQPAMPVIGFLHSASRDPSLSFVAGLKRGLEEAGLVEGRNVAIEYRWAQGEFERLPALAAELVRHPVSVIIAGGGPRSALAAKAATSTIPVVFASGSDPVKLGVVESLNRPGGNLTGVVFFNSALVVKRLELLRELVPSATRVGLLANPSNPTEAEPQIRDAREAARVLGVELQVLPASSGQDIEAVFSTLSERRLAGLVMSSDPFLGSRRGQVAVFAARHGMPAVSDIREFASAGGLASYGNSISDVYRQVGVYVARILNGAKSAELPVVQPVKFELVINLNTAKALGLEVPPALLARADEVIE